MPHIAARLRALLTFGGIALLCSAALPAQDPPTPEQLEFFEQKIRPVLVENCYVCHNSHDRTEAGLALDHRAGWQGSGRRSSVIVPGRPERSRLIRAVRSSNLELRMPQGEAALSAEVIADLERWIEMGAPDPREEPPTVEQHQATTSWDAIRKQRLSWWSFRPVADPPLPAAVDAAWSRPVDRFVRHRIAAAGLEPSEIADPRTLLRRLRFVLTGLPPTPSEAVAFETAVAADRTSAIESVVDDLLASPAFGERWARHWMDWLRFAETHGAEIDPAIPYAWRYRDYLIRALNQDVPYDQLVLEHLAGDVLPTPRLSADGTLNESAIGTANLRFVIHGHSPTDALDEQVRFTDNQIDVTTKAFQALTVSCARCHNHKFDPISQTDYYALYGVMASSRPGIVTLDRPEHARRGASDMTRLKGEIRGELAAAWLQSLDGLPRELMRERGAWGEALRGAISSHDPLYVWQTLKRARGRSFRERWEQRAAEIERSRAALEEQGVADALERWGVTPQDPLVDLEDVNASRWFAQGSAFPEGPVARAAGFFDVLAEGDRIIGGVRPAGIYSHALSTRHSAVLGSSRFTIEGDDRSLFVRVLGGGGAAARYAVQNFPTGGETYPIELLEDGEEQWVEWDLSYWDGDQAYIELTTAADRPLDARDVERSWFGITGAALIREGQDEPRRFAAEAVAPLFDLGMTPTDRRELAELYVAALRRSIEAWRDQRATDADARFLDAFVRRDLLPNSSEALDGRGELLELVARYRALENQLPVPTRVAATAPGTVFDQQLMVRGSHKQLAEPVARRFLESFDDSRFGVVGAGRLDLAARILDPGNPLTARVIVNRIWHHVFGSGLVATPDNFGRMGEEPSHPELLDHLAVRFVENGWSIKTLVRELVLSRTFQLSSVPSNPAVQAAKDPSNRLLAHAPVRRLEAEAIRDAMLLVGGHLDDTLLGPSVASHVPRRGLYVRVWRYGLDPFLTTFDAPTPVSSVGRRDQTNVPAQSLALMNDPFALGRAREFARSVAGGETTAGGDQSVIAAMYERAFGRSPLPGEVSRALTFLDDVRARSAPASSAEIAALENEIDERRRELDQRVDETLERIKSLARFERDVLIDKRFAAEAEKIWRLQEELEQKRLLAGPLEPWNELARALFAMKEFIYLR